jgi:hypothetical protein
MFIFVNRRFESLKVARFSTGTSLANEDIRGVKKMSADSGVDINWVSEEGITFSASGKTLRRRRQASES